MTATTMSETDVPQVPRIPARQLSGIWLRPPPTMVLTKAQRRAASRALLPGGAVAPEHRATTAQVARHLRGYQWAPWLFIALGVLGSAAFLITESPVSLAWGGVALAAFVFAGVYLNALRKARAIIIDEFGG